MGFQACPGVLQIEAIYNQAGEVVENVFHTHSDTAWTHSLLVSMVGAWVGWESATGKLHRANTTGLIKMRLVDLTTANGVEYITSIAPAQYGTNGAGCNANNVTWCVKGNTGLRGRSARGRFYYCGLPGAACIDNIIQSAFATAVLADYDNLLSTLNAVNNSSLGVLSRVSGKAPRGTGILYPYTDFVYTDLDADSQRRRLPAHNRHH